MSKAKEFTGLHMALVAGAFFAVVISVNVVMIVSSSTTWTGLVVQNSYVASQEFQERVDAAHAQDAAGWSMEVAYEGGHLVVLLRDDGEVMDVDDVSAFVRRPVGGHDDATVALTRTGDRYEGALELAPGVWDVTVTTGATELGPIARETRILVR